MRRVVQRFISLPLITRFFAPFIAKVDRPILKLTKGHFSPTGFIAGWPVINLTTTGAKSGKPRTIPLIGISDGQKIILIATNFGLEKNPAWYHNLKSNSAARVSYRGLTTTYRAYEASEDERERYWQMAETTYPGYRQYRQRSNRVIPVMVLEPEGEKIASGL